MVCLYGKRFSLGERLASIFVARRIENNDITWLSLRMIDR